MYSTCLHCLKGLGTNELVEHFQIGRLAFDSAKARLWAVCPHCSRWNLTPIEEPFRDRLRRRVALGTAIGTPTPRSSSFCCRGRESRTAAAFYQLPPIERLALEMSLHE